MLETSEMDDVDDVDVDVGNRKVEGDVQIYVMELNLVISHGDFLV